MVKSTSTNPFDSFEQARWTPFLLRAVICYRQDTLTFFFVVKKVCGMKLVLSFHCCCIGNVLTLYDWSRWDTIKGDKEILQTPYGQEISQKKIYVIGTYENELSGRKFYSGFPTYLVVLFTDIRTRTIQFYYQWFLLKMSVYKYINL